MLRGSSGFYSYAIYQHWKEWPGFNLGETRLAFKLRKDKYQILNNIPFFNVYFKAFLWTFSIILNTIILTNNLLQVSLYGHGRQQTEIHAASR